MQSKHVALALAERERRRRQQAQYCESLCALPVADFMRRTKIEDPYNEQALIPFDLWPAQVEVLDTLAREQLIMLLKARQLGMTWLVCGYAHRLAVLYPGQPILALSQGQLEANEIIRRIKLLHDEHDDKDDLPTLTTDNTSALRWSNNSRVLSLPATKKAGRSFTARLVILDEWAFMLWPSETLAAVKPTIDAGGQLIIISSADGYGSPYHAHWQAATHGTNGYTPVFLPWYARPDRGPDWRDQKLREAGNDEASVLREYPANDIEAFTHASGVIYSKQWSDGPADGNVTEAAEYIPDGGPVYWMVDDGYSGQIDQATNTFTGNSHPRVIGWVQQRANGQLCVFNESYAIETLSEIQLTEALQRPYRRPEYAAVDSSAAELRGRMHDAGISTFGASHNVDEGIKNLRRMLAPDKNGVRRILVHPRCRHLRFEMAAYRYDPKKTDETPLRQFDHGPDALRYLGWTQRYE